MSKFEIYTITCIPALLGFFVVLLSLTCQIPLSIAETTYIIVSGMVFTGLLIKTFQRLMYQKVSEQLSKPSAEPQQKQHIKSTINSTASSKFHSPSCEEDAPTQNPISNQKAQLPTPEEQALMAKALLPFFTENTESEMGDYYKAFLLALFHMFPSFKTLLTTLEELFPPNRYLQGNHNCLYFKDGNAYKRPNNDINAPFKHGASYDSLRTYVSTFRKLKDFSIQP